MAEVGTRATVGELYDAYGRRDFDRVAALIQDDVDWVIYGPVGVFPPYSLALLAGIASGAAMIPYTVIKEANRPEHGGTATGVINFINFSFSALFGPVFAGWLVQASGGGERALEHYQVTFQPLIWGVCIAIVLALLLRETGPAVRRAAEPQLQPQS